MPLPRLVLAISFTAASGITAGAPQNLITPPPDGIAEGRTHVVSQSLVYRNTTDDDGKRVPNNHVYTDYIPSSRFPDHVIFISEGQAGYRNVGMLPCSHPGITYYHNDNFENLMKSQRGGSTQEFVRAFALFQDSRALGQACGYRFGFYAR